VNFLPWIGACGALLVGGGAAFSAVLVVEGAASPVARLVRGYSAGVAADLRFVRKDLTPNQLWLFQGAAVLAIALWCILADRWAPLTTLPAVVALPRGLLSRARALRVTAIEGQVDTWLVILANALRATPSLGEAIESTSKLIPAPLSEELELVLSEYQLGAPLDVALKTMAERLRSRTVNVALGTLRIARTTGGNVSQTLETSAAALREIARLEGVVRTKTAEGKAQATVIAVIPFPLIALLNYMNPDLLTPLFNTLKGYGVMAVAFMMWVVAILWARKILAVDI
jgi:tight adherence protein B